MSEQHTPEQHPRCLPCTSQPRPQLSLPRLSETVLPRPSPSHPIPESPHRANRDRRWVDSRSPIGEFSVPASPPTTSQLRQPNRTDQLSAAETTSSAIVASSSSVPPSPLASALSRLSAYFSRSCSSSGSSSPSIHLPCIGCGGSSPPVRPPQTLPSRTPAPPPTTVSH